MDNFFLKTARALALQASREVLSLLHQPIHQERKEDKSIVTEADFKSDAILREGLTKAFPDHAILTEESGLSGPRDAEYVWLIDPLDGTKAFAKGVPGFSVMVGLTKLENGGEDMQASALLGRAANSQSLRSKMLRPHLGVVVDPLEGHLYEAIRGEGAFHEKGGHRSAMRVSSRNRLEDMRVVVSPGFPEEAMKQLRSVLPGPQLAPINSVGIKIGLLVRQEADIYLSHHPVHYWDTCAPQIILEEAGGSFTKLDGSPITYDLNSNFAHQDLSFATNGLCHEEVIRLVSPLLIQPNNKG